MTIRHRHNIFALFVLVSTLVLVLTMNSESNKENINNNQVLSSLELSKELNGNSRVATATVTASGGGRSLAATINDITPKSKGTNASDQSDAISSDNKLYLTARALRRLGNDTRAFLDNVLSLVPLPSPLKISSSLDYASSHKIATSLIHGAQAAFNCDDVKKPKSFSKNVVRVVAEGTDNPFETQSIVRYLKRNGPGVTPKKKYKGRNVKQKLSHTSNEAVVTTIGTSTTETLARVPNEQTEATTMTMRRLIEHDGFRTTTDTTIMDTADAAASTTCDPNNTATSLKKRTEWSRANGMYKAKTKNPIAASTTCDCTGFLFTVKSKDYDKLHHFVAKHYQKIAQKVQKCSEISSIIRNKHNEMIPLHQSIVEKVTEDLPYVVTVNENEEICIRSKNCSNKTKNENSMRCNQCEEKKSTIAKMINRSTPLGWNDEVPINKYTTFKTISSNSYTAEKKARQDAEMLKMYKKKVVELEYERNILKEHIQCGSKDTKMNKAIDKLFEVANDNFDKFQSANNDGSTTDKEKEQQRSMWDIHYEHLKQIKAKGGSKMGIKFHPTLLNYALMLVAKTSTSVYKELEHVFKLPSLTYLKQIQKEKTGSQNERQSPHGLVPSNIKEMGKVFRKHGIEKGKRKVAVAFDSMYIYKGIQWDVQGNMTGIDPHLQFDIITNKFMSMVSYKGGFHFFFFVSS